MTGQEEKRLNDFFVHVFNKITIWENQALTCTKTKDLSLKELHVLEAVAEHSLSGQDTMAAIADTLSIRASSLTASVNTLVRKGYLSRIHDEEDRRLIHIALTEKGEEANRLHSEFHTQMIRGAVKGLSETELAVLLQSLTQLNHFFTDMIRIGTPDRG
ncbi:MAG: winged helix DNA-binding protein [Lachnospiraceae bacterium]|nr:winged helix DNA-binding protein [Lachnospiraceae bacterium]